MKYLFNILLINSYLFSQTNFEKGMKYYNSRSEDSNGIIASEVYIDSAIYFFTMDKKNNQSSLMLLKSLYFKGEFVSQLLEKKKQIFEQAKNLGELLIKNYPNVTSFRYWYIVNLGSWGKTFGIIHAARQGVADIIKENSEKIIELDSKYQNGGGYFMLGVINYRSPYIPFFLTWPDKNIAIKFLQKAYKTGESTPVQIKFLAKALYENGQKSESISLFKELSGLNPHSNFLLEQNKEIFEAVDFLKKIK